MSTVTDKICPYCKGSFKEDDIIIECPKCGIPHHEECWKENGGCSTFGCTEKQDVSDEQPISTNTCSQCGTTLSEEQTFCPNCGTEKQQKVVNKNICSKCGNEINENQSFCPKCGQRVGLEIEQNTLSSINSYNQSVANKNKKSKTLPIIIAVIVLVVSIGGYYGYQYYKIQNKIKGIESLIYNGQYYDAADECFDFLDENKNDKVEKLLIEAKEGMKTLYLTKANKFYEQAYTSGVNLENVGSTITDNWHSYLYDYYSQYYSIDDAVSSALDEKSSEVLTAETEKSELDELCNYLVDVPFEDQTLIDISDCVVELYDTYQSFYEIVTSPTGNYNSFTSEFNSTDNDLANILNELSNLLE